MGEVQHRAEERTDPAKAEAAKAAMNETGDKGIIAASQADTMDASKTKEASQAGAEGAMDSARTSDPKSAKDTKDVGPDRSLGKAKEANDEADDTPLWSEIAKKPTGLSAKQTKGPVPAVV